jgi:RNA polymerase sigma-70 factor (ECF subfamily)
VDRLDWQQNPEKALEEVFRSEYVHLCRSALRLVGRADVAEDLVQDAFLEVWRRRENLDFRISVQAYLRRAVANRSLNYLRDNRRTTELTPEISARPGHLNGESPTETAELQRLISDTIDRLPDKCREAFLLSRYDGFSYKEIAEKLGISVKTVEKHIAKGLLSLRNVLRANHFLKK